MNTRRAEQPPAGWHFWIDRGGTFTDVVARSPEGRLRSCKLLAENPRHYQDSTIEGIRRLLGLAAGEALPVERIAALHLGTTVATNALLERSGEDTLLVVSEGFRDALYIGYQERPQLFALHIHRPPPLYREVLEVRERIDARGQVRRPLDEEDARRKLEAAWGRGLRSCAVVLMHSCHNPRHEEHVARLAREAGFTQVSLGHAAAPVHKLVVRGNTAVVDAYLSPVLRRYVERLGQSLGAAFLASHRLLFMQSNGGLVDASALRGRDALLSGPAGGVVGMIKTGRARGLERMIGFDMGGTSTDVSHYRGEYERVAESQVAGIRLHTPSLLIHTVAAGGGSLLHFDGSRYRVGPESAGAHPGPACYGKGGPLTVTDCNLLLGRIHPDFFPRVFGPNADQPLDVAVVRRRFEELARDISARTGRREDSHAVAAGFLRIAVDNMANAIKNISVRRGYELSRYTLCCYGGAAGQHACRVAASLGIEAVYLHPHAGVLSALGIGLGDARVVCEQAWEEPLEEERYPSLQAAFEELRDQGSRQLRRQGRGGEVRLLRRVRLRYSGTDQSLEVLFATPVEMRRAFEERHRERYGFVFPGQRELTVEALEIEAIAAGEELPGGDRQPAAAELPPAAAWCRMIEAGRVLRTPLYRRAELPAGSELPGPALIVEEHSTVVVEPGWRAHCSEHGELLLRRAAAPAARKAALARRRDTRRDAVLLEIFHNLFMSVAEQMGAVLENVAVSVNIKERRDFSCALFDPQGYLVANAPHIPVHLGSIGDSVRHVIRRCGGTMRPGDLYAHNVPYEGGTHLPDITVIKPVHRQEDGQLLCYVAARGHHGDVGGISPGSMPPHSRNIEEEGVLIESFPLVKEGRPRFQQLRALLEAGPWPARNVEDNLRDLQAQIAACERGRREFLSLVEQFGSARVAAYMGHVQDNAAEEVRRLLGTLGDGSCHCLLDDGTPLRLTLRVDRRRQRARIDFQGTGACQEGNRNAPPSVVRAAVLYVFRTLVGGSMPLNDGCLAPLDIVLPAGSLLRPVYPAAVAGGNVETSQLVVDLLFGALGVMAASQGTMNNLTFGNARYQYYETICGGAGATAQGDGADGVHTHMTNSRLTDPEVLERRFPVLLESFALRAGSGGAGRHRGGDGVIRRLRFLEKMEVALLAERRRWAPFGLAGGEAGRKGAQYLEKRDGRRVPLHTRAQVEAGDLLVVETPGGGGYGPTGERPPDAGE